MRHCRSWNPSHVKLDHNRARTLLAIYLNCTVATAREFCLSVNFFLLLFLLLGSCTTESLRKDRWLSKLSIGVIYSSMRIAISLHPGCVIVTWPTIIPFAMYCLCYNCQSPDTATSTILSLPPPPSSKLFSHFQLPLCEKNEYLVPSISYSLSPVSQLKWQVLCLPRDVWATTPMFVRNVTFPLNKFCGST
jgi:hypothetical protein